MFCIHSKCAEFDNEIYFECPGKKHWTGSKKNEHFSWKAHLEIIWSISLTFCTVFAKLHALAPVFSNDGYIEFRVHQLNLYFSLETANSTVLLRNPNPNELVNWTKSSKLKFIAISSCWIFLFQVKILPIRFKLDWIINFFEEPSWHMWKIRTFIEKKVSWVVQMLNVKTIRWWCSNLQSVSFVMWSIFLGSMFLWRQIVLFLLYDFELYIINSN